MKMEMTDGPGVIGVNMQASYPTAAAMDPSFRAPSYCGQTQGPPALVHACANSAGATQTCCCAEKGAGLAGCQVWTCCADGAKCTVGKGCAAQ